MRTSTIIAATFLLSVATIATAQSPIVVNADSDVPTTRVFIGDLNLAAPAGQRTLHYRLASAIEDVCGGYAGKTDLGETMQIQQCRDAAQAQANQQLAARSSSIRLAAR